MKRQATAHWSGGIKDGTGTLSTPSGALEQTPYSYRDRFEDGPRTNPEELLGAAHAGCYAMALSGQLGDAGMTAESLDVTASVSLEKQDDGFAITAVHLDLKAKIPGAEHDAFMEAANNARTGCPVSKLFKADITLDAQLVG